MIEELIVRVFASRNATHLEHWRTKSFAQHKALGHFYDDVIDDLDKLVEAHQGVIELVDVAELPKQPKAANIISHLEEDVVWINKNRKAITSGLPALDNILQELEHTYMVTLYKLKHLS